MNTASEYTVKHVPEYTFQEIHFDPWTCYLFGATPGNGISYRPIKGTTPNVFVRWMMRVTLGCTWVRTP